MLTQMLALLNVTGNAIGETLAHPSQNTDFPRLPLSSHLIGAFYPSFLSFLEHSVEERCDRRVIATVLGEEGT